MRLLARLVTALLVLTLARAARAGTVVLKVGTLAPPESPWGQVFKVWKRAVQPGFDAAFAKQGFKVLGWGDVGRAHSMSRGFEVRVPSDVRHHHAFYLPGDPVAPVVFSLIGDVTPRQVALPEILPGLSNGSIDMITAPPLVAEQLQWASRLDTLGDEVAGIGIGALVFSASRYAGVPADAKALLLETGRVASQALTRRIRAEDDAALQRLQARMHHYSLTPAEKAQWERLFVETAKHLRGAVFDPRIFDEAVRHR